jgi:hypothetical protein
MIVVHAALPTHVALLLVIASGCGRLDFEPLPPDGGADSATMDTGIGTDSGVVFPDGGFVDCSDPDVACPPVEPPFPTLSGWNEYVRRDPARPFHAQLGDACDPSTPGRPSECLHVGEVRRFVVPGRTSCDGLVAQDRLAAFGWLCVEEAGTAVFYSTGLQDRRGLADLLTAGGWRENSVVVTAAGEVVTQTDTSVWWSNPVVLLPEGSGGVVTLDSAGMIYVLDASRTSHGYNIDADRIALVTLPGATLGMDDGAVANCNTETGETTPPPPPDDMEPLLFRRCIVAAGAQSFLWIEGAFDGRTSLAEASSFVTGLLLSNSRRSVIRRTTVQNGGYGILLYGTNSSFLYDVRVANVGLYGVIIGSGFGATPPAAHGNVIARLVTANIGHDFNGYAGLLYEGASTDHVFTQLLIANAQPWGLFHYNVGNDDTIYSHVTSVGSGHTIDIWESDNVHLSQVVAINSATEGINLDSISNGRFAQLVTGFNTGAGIDVAGGVAGSTFGGALIFGPNGPAGDCRGCDTAGATVIPGRLTASPFAGAVAADAVNGSGSAMRDYGAITDWVRFESRFRAWGRTEDPTAPGFRGRCASGACRILDFRLPASDTMIFDRSTNGERNAPFVEGGACPASVGGDVALADARGQDVYLINALEIFFDGVGDEDGLCESREACLYSPNFGAYQGDGGAAGDPCVFTDGTVSGVTMYRRARNGV